MFTFTQTLFMSEVLFICGLALGYSMRKVHEEIVGNDEEEHY